MIFHMRFARKLAFASALGILCFGPASAAGSGAARAPGIVVTEVGRGRAGERSGLKEGDILLSWAWKAPATGRKPQSGLLRSPIELSALENSLAAEGRITVKGTRGGKPIELALLDGEWNLSSRPNFSGGELKAYEVAREGAPGAFGDPALLLALSETVAALALTPSGVQGEEGDDGLLQAWEVYERMRVDADLVTLSACETGLGKVIEGEGLVGLTRAFQFAGARTVLASLWPVTDEGTGELMRTFYANLRAGASKDEALRAAQLQLLRGAGAGKKGARPFASPFHWAAFQLVGDWK